MTRPTVPALAATCHLVSGAGRSGETPDVAMNCEIHFKLGGCAAVALRRGFTLVEVLVSLFVMALMASMAWQGIDSMIRAHALNADAIDRVARLQTVVRQWELDVTDWCESHPHPSFDFDGRQLRLTRCLPEGVKLIRWWHQDGQLLRWSSGALRSASELNEHRSTTAVALPLKDAPVVMLEGVQAWRLTFFRSNAWTHALSSADAPASSAPRAVLPPPSGVRLELELGSTSGFAGTLVRQVEVPGGQ